MEDIEVLELLTVGREENRHAGDLADRQGGATTGVAVQLGQDDTGEPDALTERLRGHHGVLADHGIEDEQHLVGVDGVPDRARLVHQILVDAEATRGVDDHDVEVLGPGFGEAGGGNGDGITRGGVVRALHRAAVGCEHLHSRALTNDLKLG